MLNDSDEQQENDIHNSKYIKNLSTMDKEEKQTILLTEKSELESLNNKTNIAIKKPEYERMLLKDLDYMYKDTPLTKYTKCGYWIFQGSFLQK